MKQFSPQNLYKLLNHDTSIPYPLVKFLFLFSLIQFASLNMDSFFWSDPPFLQSSLISFIIKMLSFTRIYTILGVFELLDDFEETMFLIVFCIIILFSFLKINIALVFTKKMKNLIKDRLELEWERELHYKTNELGSEILKIYNIFFPILCAPVFEICSLPIYYLLSSPQNFQIWMLVLGIIGILLLFCHMFCNVFYFK